MAIPCKMAAVHVDFWPQQLIDVMKNFCLSKKLCQAVFRGCRRMMDPIRWAIAEVENHLADESNVFVLVVVLLVVHL